MKNLNKLGYTKIELLIIVILLGIVAFITINKTSYAFTSDDQTAVEEIQNLIELQAEDYAMDNLEIFSENKTTFITVNDLVENKYMVGNEKGEVLNPSNPEESYNENKIKLEYDAEKNKVLATFID